MAIPSEVKVAGIKYEVIYKEGMLRQNEILGMILYPESKIFIDPIMSDDKKGQIFVHELMHAIMNEAGVEEQDEDLVNRLAIVLFQVLKDNELKL